MGVGFGGGVSGCGFVYFRDTTKERDVDYQNARPSSFLSAPKLRFTFMISMVTLVIRGFDLIDRKQ